MLFYETSISLDNKIIYILLICLVFTYLHYFLTIHIYILLLNKYLYNRIPTTLSVLCEYIYMCILHLPFLVSMVTGVFGECSTPEAQVINTRENVSFLYHSEVFSAGVRLLFHESEFVPLIQ